MRLGITAILKDELPYVEEWLLFHYLQGINKFFLYDNDDKPGKLKEVCDKYGYLNITVYPWPGKKSQMSAYEHSIACHADEVDWMAFIDCDEFLFSPTGLPVSSVLCAYGDASIVAVHWMFYGSSGKEIKTEGLVIERFLERSRTPNQHVKSICRMCYIEGIGFNPHTFRTSGRIVNEDFVKLPFDYALSNPATAYILRINHYHTKSREEYRLRCQKRRADNGEMRDFETNFAASDVNEVVDDTMLEYVESIKEKLR